MPKLFELLALMAAIVFAVALLGLVAIYFLRPPQQAVRQEGSDQRATNQHQRDGSKSLWHRTTEDPIAFFTLWLVIFSALLSGASVIQLRLLLRGESVAERSAAAAQKSADVAEAALIKLQRASVFVPDLESKWHPDFSRPGRFWYSFRPIFQNSGASQTIDMWTNIHYELRDKPLPTEFDFPKATQSYPAIVAPRGTILGGAGRLSDDELAAVQKGSKFYYVWGTITYHDVFDGTPLHSTKFCRQLVDVLGHVTRPNEEIVEMRFVIVFAEHNTAD